MKKIAYLLLFVISFSCVKEKEKTKITLEEVTNLGFSLQNKSDRDDISAMNELYDVKAFADIFLCVKYSLTFVPAEEFKIFTK